MNLESIISLVLILEVQIFVSNVIGNAKYQVEPLDLMSVSKYTEMMVTISQMLESSSAANST